MPRLRLLLVVEDPSDWRRCKVKMLTIRFQSSSVELKIENKLSGQADTMLSTKPNGDRLVWCLVFQKTPSEGS